MSNGKMDRFFSGQKDTTIFNGGLRRQQLENATKAVLNEIVQENLSVKEALYCLEMCKEIIVSESPVVETKVYLSECNGKGYWFNEAEGAYNDG